MATNNSGDSQQPNNNDCGASNNKRPPRNRNNNSINNNRNKKKSKDEVYSRALSWALRHAAPELGLTMTCDGYVPVHEILQHKHAKFKGFTLEEIRTMVASNDKQRFSIKEDEHGTVCIRANQGHSIPGVDAEALLTRISAEELSTLTIVHGTYHDPWEKYICHQGLSKMKRNHIHFASGLPHEDDSVISGMRKTCTVFIYLDGVKCAEDGIAFFRSDNGVLLTAGVNDGGMLPATYFSHVTSSTGELIIDNRSTAKM
jgi:2'-phosphotransferase